jgi:hypothetical protein
MIEQEVVAGVSRGTEVLEVMMLLSTDQFFALEEAAYQQNMCVARLLRRAICDFLRQLGSVSACGVQEMGESPS